MRIKLFILAVFLSLNCSAQFGAFFTALSVKKPNNTVYPLDTSSGNKAAYSLRKMRAGHDSATIVRRSTDNAVQLIGFSSGELDTASLKTFIGSASGYISTWVDATGNGMHAVQSTASAQPRIVNAGVIERNSYGNPTIVFDGVNDQLNISSTSYFNFLHDGTTTSYIFSVQRFGSSSNPNAAYGLLGNNGGSTNTTGICAFFDDRSSLTRDNGFAIQVSKSGSGVSSLPVNFITNSQVTPNVHSILTIVFSPANATAADRGYIYVNEGSAAKANTNTAAPVTSNASANLSLGSVSSSLYLVGSMAEIIFYNIDKSAQKTTIINNLKLHYGL